MHVLTAGCDDETGPERAPSARPLRQATTTTTTVPVGNTLAGVAAGGVQAAPLGGPAGECRGQRRADAGERHRRCPGVAASPSALAAAIVAMQRAGNNTTTLRLDPPGLGELSVHISMNQDALVNVQLIPSVPQTAQLLNANLMDLRHAMTAAGLSLGQTQVGGNGAGGSQSQGQGGDQGADRGLDRMAVRRPEAASVGPPAPA